VAKVNSTTLGPGATVLFRRGDTWTDAGLVVSNSGTSGNPITVGAYGTGAPPIFDGGGNSTTPGARAPITIVGNWVTINGIRAQHANWAGIDVTGDDAVIRYCYLTENINGVQVNDEASRTLITSCQFVSNSVLYVGPGPDDDTGAQGIAIGGLDTEVSYCSFLNHFTTGSPDFGNDGAAIEIFGAQNANIHHNKSVNDLIFSELGADATDNCVFHHNLVYSTRPVAGGINIHGTGPFAGVTGTKVLHNTIVLTAADSVAFVADGTADCELKNNILVAANTYTENPVNEAGNVINASSFQGINSSNAGGSGLASTSSTAAALVLGASTGNFAISPASPAIGRGVTTSLTFTEDFAGAPKQSISWDAGAYEYIVPSLSENFSTYSTGAEWTEGGILGAWRAQFLGTAGYARIVDNAGDKALELKATIGSGTTSTLLTSTAALHNGGGMKITGRMRTLAQTGAVPNDWEAAWLFFHYSDRPGIADQGTGVPSGTVRTCY
jgi:hypothetical protein